MTTAEQRAFARMIECEEDGLYYARYFFKQRTGGKITIAPHHKVIQQTLDRRVINGEIQRQINNVQPGYTKTELATINMMGDRLALNYRARFMHLSYSQNLALLDSSTACGMIKSQAYQSMWPIARLCGGLNTEEAFMRRQLPGRLPGSEPDTWSQAGRVR